MRNVQQKKYTCLYFLFDRVLTGNLNKLHINERLGSMIH